MNQGHYRRLGTSWQELDKITDLINTVIEYLKQNNWCVTSNITFEEKFKEGVSGIEYKRIAVKGLSHNNGLHIMFSRFQRIPESSLNLNYRTDVDIGDIPAKKNLVDKVFSEMLTLHPLLKEKKI